MDEELLRGKGFEPKGGEIAAIDVLAFRSGQRATLVPRGRSAAQTHPVVRESDSWMYPL
jgi:hypothetical protein